MNDLFPQLQWSVAISLIAAYFFYLGLLNTRLRPVAVSARGDLLVLLVAFSPLLALPFRFLFHWVGLIGLIVALTGSLGFLALLLRRLRGWVIYNISVDQTSSLLQEILETLNVPTLGPLADHEDHPARAGKSQRFYLPDRYLQITVGGFSLLRNVTVQVQGRLRENQDLLDTLDRALHDQLSLRPASPLMAGASFLVVGSAMMVFPVILLAYQIPAVVQLVRTWLFG